MRREERFYYGAGPKALSTDDPTYPPLQTEGLFRNGRTRRLRIHPRIHALAAEEYNRSHTQSAERIAERGGFGVAEVIALLADALERERERSTAGRRSSPTPPSPSPEA